MPGMSGPELAALVRQRRPDIKLVLTSGYVGKEAVPSGLDFVVKAWRVDQVTRVVGTPGLNPVESCHPRGAGTSARSGAGRREISALEAGPPGWGGVMRRRPNAGLA